MIPILAANYLNIRRKHLEAKIGVFDTFHDAMYELNSVFLDLLPAPGWTIHFDMHNKSAPKIFLKLLYLSY